MDLVGGRGRVVGIGPHFETLSEKLRPSARRYHAMCFLPQTQRVYVLGGMDEDSHVFGDLWYITLGMGLLIWL
jgi:hypothetical protein